MMYKLRFIILAVVLIVASLSSAAQATVTVHQFLDILTQSQWWKCVNDIPTLDRPEFDWTLPAGYSEKLLNVLPVGQIDPRVRQTVVNQTVSDIWTDWHVQIENGKNLRDVLVYKVGVTPNWVIEIASYANGVGFDAHVIPSGPGNPMAVNPGEKLYIDFTYDVDNPLLPVNVIQYPTTDYPIPEPGSIMALLVGLGGFGLSALRKRK